MNFAAHAKKKPATTKFALQALRARQHATCKKTATRHDCASVCPAPTSPRVIDGDWNERRRLLQDAGVETGICEEEARLESNEKYATLYHNNRNKRCSSFC